MIRFLAVTGFSLAAMTWAAYDVGYRLNVSDSLPPGLWKISEVAAPLERGQIALVCPPPSAAMRQALASGYVRHGLCPGGFAPLLKPLAALPGDRVTADPEGFSVNGVRLANTAPLARDAEGRLLPAIDPGPHEVGRFEVWLLSDYNAASFDSRYLGAVSIGAVRAIAQPIYTFPEIPHD